MIDTISTIIGAIILGVPITVFAIWMLIELKNHIKEKKSAGKAFWQINSNTGYKNNCQIDIAGSHYSSYTSNSMGSPLYSHLSYNIFNNKN